MRGGTAFEWVADGTSLRVFHADPYTPTAISMRTYGPRARFDPHAPSGSPREDPAGRAAAYVAERLPTALHEVLARDLPIAEVCPNWRATVVHPVADPIVLQDLVVKSPLALGAPDDLGDSPPERYPETQQWARAMYEDRPADPRVAGIRYWSRQHRGTKGERAGVNRVVWDTAPALRVLAHDTQGIPMQQEFSLHTPELWSAVVVTLDAVGLAARRIPATLCDKCLKHSVH